jgi:mRNA deadenylase 3'-5' endonuclease subunit Ccr4
MTIAAESSSLPPSTWVDRLRMVPILPDTLSKDTKNSYAAADQDQGTDNGSTRHLEFNIVSLNMLAETYVSPRSHPGLPDSYANVAFDKGKRRELLVDNLERFCSPCAYNNECGSSGSDANKKWDIIALQELDLVGPDDPILPAFQRWGYQVIRTPNDQRKDCCAIAFDKSKFTLIEYEVVKFDDLATMHHSTKTMMHDANSKAYKAYAIDCSEASSYSSDLKSKKSSTTPPELTGLVRSFLRRNYAIMAHLKSIDDKTQSFIVASVHLYWNPGFEYVKLCQAKYLLDRVAEFASIKTMNGDSAELRSEAPNVMLLPTIICGDMNSKPGSTVHSLFVKPYVDARTVAPWNYFWDPDEEIMYTEEDELDGQDLVVAATSNLTNEIDLSVKDGLTGYTMNGFSADFAMYCGLAVDDKDCTLSGTTESTRLNDQSDGYDEINESYDGLRSSLLSWNGLHKRTANTSISCGSTNSTFPTDTPLGMNDATNNDDDGLRASLAWSKLHQRSTPQDYQHALPPLKVKYMLDYTLNRFTR